MKNMSFLAQLVTKNLPVNTKETNMKENVRKNQWIRIEDNFLDFTVHKYGNSLSFDANSFISEEKKVKNGTLVQTFSKKKVY